MKRSISRWLSLAFAPIAALVLLGVVTPAHADYIGDCTSAPSGVISGNISIFQATGDCDISHPLSATGSIKIWANLRCK